MNKKWLKVSLNFLLFTSFAVSAQTNSERIDDIGKNVLGQIKAVQSSFSDKMIETYTCFPEYKQAMNNKIKEVNASVIEFEKGLEEDKALLKSKFETEVSKNQEIKKLLDGDPQNVAFKKLLADSKRRMGNNLREAERIFAESYKKRVDEFVFTFPLRKAVIDLKYGTNSSSHTWFSAFDLGGNEITDGVLVVKNMYISNFIFEGYTESNKQLNPKWIESTLVSYIGDKKINTNTEVFNDCETAGCVYLLNEQIKSWLLSVQKIDMSLSLVESPLELNIKKKGIIASEDRINRVLDRLSSIKGSTLPIGMITPSCVEKNEGGVEVINSLVRSNVKEVPEQSVSQNKKQPAGSEE